MLFIRCPLEDPNIPRTAPEAVRAGTVYRPSWSNFLKWPRGLDISLSLSLTLSLSLISLPLSLSLYIYIYRKRGKREIYDMCIYAKEEPRSLESLPLSH